MGIGIICGAGINDMTRGWASASEYNKKVYRVWCSMLNRCYSEKYHEKNPTYINTTLQLEWHWLSYFTENIQKIDGFDYELFMNGELNLDKDIKSNGECKEYSLENCKFVSKSENSKQANKTRDNTYLQGENNPMYGVRRCGENHPWYGKHHTEETLEKLRKPKSEEHKRKISEARKGKYKGENHPCAILVDRFTLDGQYVDTDCAINYERLYGFRHQAISKCCKGQYKSTGTGKGTEKFVFKYHEELVKKDNGNETKQEKIK